MTSDDLAECALAAGATQLGEAGTVHYLFNLDQLAAFARPVRPPRFPRRRTNSAQA